MLIFRRCIAIALLIINYKCYKNGTMSRIIAMIVRYSCYYDAATQEELLVVGRPTDTTDTTVATS